MTDKTETAEDGNFLALIEEHEPKAVIVSTKARAALFQKIEEQIAAFEPDLTTATGRAKIKSLAFKIVKTRTALTAAADELTEEWRTRTAAVVSERKAVETRLKELEASVKAPLTKWEEAEKTRLADVEQAIANMNSYAVVPLGATGEQVEGRLNAIRATEYIPEVFQGALEAAEAAKTRTIAILEAALARIRQEEADRAELQRLREEAEARRKADEEREQREREAREAAAKADMEAVEAANQAARDAEEARQAADRLAIQQSANVTNTLAFIATRIEDQEGWKLPGYIADLERIVPDEEDYGAKFTEIAEKRDAALAELRQLWSAEQERIQREAAERAAEQATIEAEARAAAAAAEAQRAAEEALAAERARAAEAEAARERERKEREAEDRQRAEAAAAEASRRKKAEADRDHRRQCKTEAKDALIRCGCPEDVAQVAVLAILAGEIPRVSLDFAAEPKVVSAREAFDEARAESPEAETADA